MPATYNLYTMHMSIRASVFMYVRGQKM